MTDAVKGIFGFKETREQAFIQPSRQSIEQTENYAVKEVINAKEIYTNDLNINGHSFTDYLALIVPIGTVLPWHGSATGVPALMGYTDWVLCDGSAYPAGGTLTGNTPDLRGKFVRGNTTSGTTGGSDTHNHGGATGQPSATTGTGPTAGGSSDRHTHTISSANNIPAYVEMVFIIKYK